MEQFLFLGTRAEDAAADSEYAAVLRYSGLDAVQLERRRLEAEPLGPVDLDDYAGIIVGGGPFNVSDPADSKSATQLRVEAELNELAHRVVASDFPFLGACYGVGTLGVLHDGIVDRTYGEPVGPVTIELTDAGVLDPLFMNLPREFDALLGHKEAVTRLPEDAVNLATSLACPVQAFRIGANVYATQFHPEMDAEGLSLRVDVYREYGYFDPSEAEELKARADSATITEPGKILEQFVRLYC